MALWCHLWALWCALCCTFAQRGPAPAPPHRDVVTSSGVARGYLKSRPPHYAFLGLPYARSQAARGQFKAAKSPVRWEGVFEATYRVRCAQPGRKGDAACLALNVFSPERADSRPVLVHLHAGHFATGWGSHSAPPRLLSLGFVVVTLNYRLGADGFLCLGTSEAPGNAGLKDQVAALAWIHENIDKFGGNSAQVTLYGTGAGAAAAELLLLSGAIDGFIQRVIMESGSALAPTSLSADPVAAALVVARALGYEDDGTKTSDDLAAFYQNIDVGKTLDFSNRFAPCVENVADYYSALLIKDPKEILQSGILASVPLLITYSKERSLDDDDLFHNVPNNFKDLLPSNLEFDNEDLKFRIGEQVKESYFGELETGVDIVENFESYINDVFTVYPIVKSATLHAAVSNSPVYLMELFPRDESNTIFEYIFGRETFSDDEELIAQKLVAMWSNFMLYSDPTPLETTLLPVLWLPVSYKVRNEKPDISTVTCLMFNLGQLSMSMGSPSSGHTLPIWDHIYDHFYKSQTQKLSENDLTLYNEELALISTLSQQGSRIETEDIANKNDAMTYDENTNEGSDGNDNYEHGNNGSDDTEGSGTEDEEYISADENAGGDEDMGDEINSEGGDLNENDQEGYDGNENDDRGYVEGFTTEFINGEEQLK